MDNSHADSTLPDESDARHSRVQGNQLDSKSADRKEEQRDMRNAVRSYSVGAILTGTGAALLYWLLRIMAR